MAKTPPAEPEPLAEGQQTPTKPGWTAKYDAITSSLPTALSARLPSSDTAATAVSLANDRLTTLGNSSKQQWDSLSRASSQRAAEMSRAGSEAMDATRKSTAEQWKKRGPDAWMECVWVVRNETQVPINVSLNQVGPLYYEVLKPEETFERRVPKLPFSLELRPYTSPSTAYTPWSTTWPILAVTGPAVALTSLLAIPLVAVAAGGTALASLSAFGSSVAAGAAAAGDAAIGTAAAATAFVAKANSLPGARQVKGKLADAAKKAVGERGVPTTKAEAQRHVVRYLMARKNGEGEGEGEDRLIEEDAEGRKKRAKKEGKVDEVEVTGYDLEKVLICETGNSKLDKALAKAFKRLSIKSKLKQFKTADNPVLRIVGGPELDTRTPAASFLHPNPAPKTFLVFYPFALLHTPPTLLRAEPVPTSEVPPTEDEARVMKDARVVEKWETAEKASRAAPEGVEGQAEGRDGKREEAERAVEEAEREEGSGKTTVEQSVGKGKEKEGEMKKDGEEKKEKKKGWFW
ncbi:hypothetical protein JCM6882_001248 [Rhodosporidiobolus microsporus]